MQKFYEEFTGYIQTDIFLTAAKLKDWNIDVFLKGEFAFAEIRKGKLAYRVSRDSISLNSNVSTKISKNKHLSNLILKRYLPEYVTQADVYEIDSLTDQKYQELLQLHKKLVVKPIDENNGVGVTTSLTDIESIKNAVEKVRKLGAKRVLIENHIEIHKEYRVMLWRGKVIDVLHRIPAYVTGDGHSTIQELIEQKNKSRFDHFENVFEPIVIDDDLSLLLQKKGMTLASVLPDQEWLTVKLTCNLSTGGEVKRVELNKIHSQFHEIFQKVYEATWMNYCGLDLISPDIEQAPVVGQTVINELNGAPGLTLAFFDDLATNRPFYGMFQLLEKMENDPVTF